jgi:hypothetical protein
MFQVYVLNDSSVSNVCCKWFIWMLQWLYTYVVSVCFKYFSCFKRILQVFYDVAYVVLAIHICCKCMFQMFQLFQTYIASVSVLSGCCICCSGHTHMLQAMFVNVSFVSDVCCSKCFMLQVLHNQAREVGADRGGPLMGTGSQAGAAAPTCMRRRMRTIRKIFT